MMLTLRRRASTIEEDFCARAMRASRSESMHEVSHSGMGIICTDSTL